MKLFCTLVLLFSLVGCSVDVDNGSKRSTKKDTDSGPNVGITTGGKLGIEISEGFYITPDGQIDFGVGF